MTALRGFGLGTAGVQEIQCLLVTTPLQVMTQHGWRVGTELLLQLQNPVERGRNLIGLAL